ncbi:MAG TPA: efflux RND transporter periplasmic adaptor subunit [Clostridia bacterium]|nr:efflux RND transporter periplasmic adaptor subunit [Clostridia bacterium]
MKNKKTKIIIAVILILAAASGAVWTFAAGMNSADTVETGLLQPRNLLQTISVTGNIEARDKEEIFLSSQQKVEEIHTDEGQKVKKDDIILSVDTTDLEYQLSKYEINLDLAERNLDRLLRKGSMSDRRSLENSVKQADINVSNAAADYEEAKKKFEQNHALYDAGAVSKEEYDSSEKKMRDLKNQMELSHIQLSNAQDSLADFGTNLEDQIADQRNQIEAAKADIANTKEKISRSTVKASIDGKVVRLDARENQYPTQDNNSIAIYDLSLYKVSVEVSQYDAVSINKGQKASIKVKGLDKAYTGTVSKIGEAAAIKLEGTNKEVKVEIEITLDNPDEKIKVGYEADIDIILQESSHTLAVDFEALQQEEDGSKYVFVLEDGKAVKKYVKTGMETDFDIQILEGLKAGEKFLKNPPEGLKDSDPVQEAEVAP